MAGLIGVSLIVIMTAFDLIVLTGEIEVLISPDGVLICARNMPLNIPWCTKSIKAWSRIGVERSNSNQGRTRAIRVFTEHAELLFGEQLTLEEQDIVLAEIKKAYVSWGLFQV